MNLTNNTYTMAIEKRVEGRGMIVGEIVAHPFHLGTDYEIAVGFVMEELRKPGVVSVALRGPDGTDIFDERDLPEFDAVQYHEDQDYAEGKLLGYQENYGT